MSESRPGAHRGSPMTPENERAFRGLERKLEAAGRSPKTIAAYHQACLSLQCYLIWSGGDGDLLGASADDVMDWLTELQHGGGWRVVDGRPEQSGKPMAKDSVNSYFSSCRRFYNWALERDMITASPFKGLEQPPASGRIRKFPADEIIADVLATCQPPKGHKRSFEDVRDEFILRLFSETGGPRCSEVALLPLDRLNLIDDVAEIQGKGDRWRIIPLSPPTAEAGQRYLRARKAHRKAARTDRVFIGLKGPLTPSGVYQIAIRRSQLAGHGKIHPHLYRHAATHAAKKAGIPDGDIMILSGWTTTRMLARYGAALAQERAVQSARKHNLAGRF